MNKIEMFVTVLVVFALVSTPLGVHCVSTVVVDPVRDDGVEAALVVIPGAEIRGEAYLPLAERIQQKSPLKLWVALTTDYIGDTPFPPQITLAINDALDELQRIGMPANIPIFYAGHSLGGTFLQSYVNRDPSRAKGVMMWGSYLTGALDDLGAYPTPIMHLSGDLDGQVKIARIGNTFRDLETLLTEDQTALATKPVIVVEGVNHFQFASGDIPPAVVRGDIPAEVTADEAWTLLAEVIGDFMSYNMDVNKATAFQSLNARYVETQRKIAPLSSFKDLEWNGTASTWIRDAQKLVNAFPEDILTPVTIYNVGYTNQRQFEESKPSVVKDSDGMVLITTRSKVEFPVNPIDISSLMNSANEIAGKMKNQEAVKKIVKGDGYGNSATCRVINEEAYRSAYNIAPAIVQSRYDTKGKQMIFSDDVNTSTGSEWVDSHVKYETLADGSLQVTSSALYTNVDFPFVTLAGMYYCKLMSPYRALEWMYVDSLRPDTTN
ncbi:uncharacterized protein LOC129258688 [Lytechinus pictus]|uniref:uncharacterized protein LOC129258688 n=1 Tax=Lytechinus pictus TaxID=7653 RepID=UPI0030B9FCF1